MVMALPAADGSVATAWLGIMAFAVCVGSGVAKNSAAAIGFPIKVESTATAGVPNFSEVAPAIFAARVNSVIRAATDGPVHFAQDAMTILLFPSVEMLTSGRLFWIQAMIDDPSAGTACFWKAASPVSTVEMRSA